MSNFVDRILVSCVAGVTLASTAVAQQAPSSDASSQSGGGAELEAIVVTAQKRSENSQDVPVSLSVFGPKQLEDLGVTNVEGMMNVVPGLVIQNTSGGLQAYIRGIGSSPSNITQEGAVGVYVDGVYQAPLYATNQQFADVQRVEVLKGPQGTLYGRNNTGGAINIITQDPSETPTGLVESSYGNYGTTQVKGYLSGGNDVVAGSLSAVFNRHEGYVTNLATGNDNLDNENVVTVRGKLRFNISDEWKLTLIGAVSQQNDTGGQTYVHLTDSTPAGDAVADPHGVYLNVDQVAKKDINDWSAAAKVQGSLGPVDLVSITSYSRASIGSGVETDMTNADLQSAVFHQWAQNFSQEIQVLSPSEGRFTWIVGGFYYWLLGGFDQFNLYNRATVTDPQLDIQLNAQQMTHAISGFGEGTFHVTDQFGITVGARYNHEAVDLQHRSEAIVGLGVLANDPQQSTDWNNFSPKVSFTYKMGDHLFYATASRGFKSGVYNILAPGTPAVNPETITAFEIGNKNTFSRFTINPAIFLYDYKNLQVDVIDPSSNFSELQNAASVRNYGADLDITAAITSQFNIGVGAEYLHARFGAYNNAEIYVPSPDGGNVSARAPSLKGNTPTLAPTFSINTTANYRIPLSVGELRLSGSWQHSTGYFLEASNRVRQPAYDLVGGRVEWQAPKGFSVYGYINNALNKDIVSFGYITNFGDGALYSDPRIYGVGASYRF